MSLYFAMRCLGFCLIMMCRWLIWVLRSSYAISGRGKECIQSSLLWLVQYGTTGKCPSFCCKDLFVTFLNFRFMLMSILNSTVQSVPCHSNNMQQARHCRHLNHEQRVMQCKRIRCCVCSNKNKETRTKFKCRECNTGLCATPCIEIHHIKLRF
jgi:hypothetical protein